jgi:hypothetical protein
VTQRTRRTPAPGAAAIRTLLRKSKPPACALHLAGTFACRTNNDWSTNVAGAIATRTLFGTIDREIRRQPFDRFFKRQTERHLDVRATLWLWPRRLLVTCRAATEKIGEDVLKTAPGSAAAR